MGQLNEQIALKRSTTGQSASPGRGNEVTHWVKLLTTQAWQPELHPWNPCEARRRELTPQSPPLILTVLTHACKVITITNESLFIREMKTKTTLKFHLTQSE